MKRKILALGLLSMCALGMFTSESKAFFGLFDPYNPCSFCNRHHRYVTQITCRPYNAFTPICWGNLICDGCCPQPCGVAGGCMPMNMGVPPFNPCCGGGGCMPYMGGGCGADGCMASDMGGMPMQHMPMQPMPNSPPPSFQPPMPMPVGPGITTAYPPMPSGVSQANFNPMYAPQYYYPNYYMPTYYNPYPQPMPYYWYGSGR